jgi:TRAP-type uncharacterized transport system fused permease subunit
MFIFETSLLMIGDWQTILLSTASASIGVVVLAAGLFGYLVREARPWERLFLIASALLLIKPGLVTDLIGVGLLTTVVASQLAFRGAKPVASQRASK